MTYLAASIRPVSLAEKLWRINWFVLFVAALIAGAGTLALYSVAGGSVEPWAERHALRFLIALGLLIVIALVRIQLWLKLAYPAFVLALLLLALVPLIGTDALGARRWLAVGSWTFQPSELMKIALLGALARYYQWLPVDRVSRPQFVAIPLAMIAVPVMLTIRQPDLGSAILFVVTGLAIMFLAGVSIFYFLSGIVGVAAALPVVWNSLHDYQRRRVEIFLNPESDPLGAGYHITQAKIALGAGGATGKGMLLGTQSQLDFVPEKHTDFILTLLGEEWGFAGLVLLLALYVLLLLLVFSMAWRCRNQFGRLVIAGVGATLFIYVFINVAMVTGLVPVVGVPLPLVSYGGTSMMTLMLGLGLAMSAYVHGGESIRRNELRALW